MKDVDFYKTKMGIKYYNYDLPELIKSNNRLAEALENQNKIEEKKLLLEKKKLKLTSNI